MELVLKYDGHALLQHGELHLGYRKYHDDVLNIADVEVYKDNERNIYIVKGKKVRYWLFDGFFSEGIITEDWFEKNEFIDGIPKDVKKKPEMKRVGWFKKEPTGKYIYDACGACFWYRDAPGDREDICVRLDHLTIIGDSCKKIGEEVG